MQLRWGICSAAKICNDFCVALKTFPGNISLQLLQTGWTKMPVTLFQPKIIRSKRSRRDQKIRLKNWQMLLVQKRFMEDMMVLLMIKMLISFISGQSTQLIMISDLVTNPSSSYVSYLHVQQSTEGLSVFCIQWGPSKRTLFLLERFFSVSKS